MKNITGGILFCMVVFAAPVVSGGQEPAGVAGVDVVVKQNRSKHDVTNSDGVFALEALPAGVYTLSFRARPAKESKGVTSNKVIVATAYSLKIEGTKRPVNESGLTSDKLVAGVDVSIEVGPGAKVRGRVLSGSSKKMVWIPPVVGSSLPGHWAEEGSLEAAHHNVRVQSAREWQDTNR
jgi:hypothetical protein